MAEMPRTEKTVRQRITDYALGMLFEALWILALCATALLIAVVAVAVVR